MKKVIFIFLISILSNNIFAQRKPIPTEGFLSFGFHLGGGNYFGDLYSNFSHTRVGGGFHINRKLSPRWHSRLSLNVIRVFANDGDAETTSSQYARNLHFRNDIKELALELTYDILPSPQRYDERKIFTPYLVSGIILLHHNPKAKLGENWFDLQALGTEGQGNFGYDEPYNKVQFAVPVGLGLKLQIHERVDISLETAMRFTFFDYLDDVSKLYPDWSDLGNPNAIALSNRTLEDNNAINNQERNIANLIEQYGAGAYIGTDGNPYTYLDIASPTSPRGNPDSRDLYLFTTLRFSYIIDVGLRCPQFR